VEEERKTGVERLVLRYFHNRGRAELVRLVLEEAGLGGKYEQQLHTIPEVSSSCVTRRVNMSPVEHAVVWTLCCSGLP
jgi:hypothetical protein